jgi:GNAT superfamily N-acetyltransferase
VRRAALIEDWHFSIHHYRFSMNIIQATLEHADSIAPVFDAYRQFYGQAPNLERCRTFIAKRLINRESVIFFVADETSPHHVLGFTQLYPAFSSVAMRRLWILNDLFVLPEARKKGIAAALMHKAREFAKETAAKGLVLETATDNSEAQRLYEKLGWQRDELFYRYFINI